MNLTFDFETGFTSKTQVKKCTTKLKGIKAEEGCQIIFNNSINMDCSKEKIESIIDTSDNAKIHSEPEASVYWYLNHGLQVRYINNSSQSRIKWVYFYMSDPTLDKNIEIMAKWRKEN